jgi:hypothetical protein
MEAQVRALSTQRELSLELPAGEGVGGPFQRRYDAAIVADLRASRVHGRPGRGAHSDPSRPSDLPHEGAALAGRLLEAIARGELTAPRRLVRLLEAMLAAGEPHDAGQEVV